MKNFIRENMALVIIAAVAVVGASALGVVGRMVGGGVNELVEERTNLSRQLRRQATGERVSEEKLQQKSQDVEKLQRQADDVAAETLEWNQRNYELLRLSAGDRDVPAFPINDDVYKQYSLRFKFMTAYNDELNSLVEPLRVTHPPDEQQIESRAVAWDEYLREQSQQADDQEQPAESPTERPWERGETEYIRRSSRGDGSSSDRDRSISDEARTYGRRDAIRRQARSGLIYLQPDEALHNLLPEQSVSRASITNELLWFAQINLWVQSDILRAIRETNEEFITESDGDPAQAGVFDSAVKRLMNVEVDDRYYFGESQEEDQPTRSEFGRERRGAGPTGRGDISRYAPTLTMRVTEQFHDVVRYRFTVVMRPDQTVRLMEKLMNQNCHSVLKYSFAPVGESEDSSDSDDSLYDYGPDPVRAVTFEGELLLLTPWTRGQWDSEAEEWSEEYPPLVPTEVLQRMPAGLRDADRRRLQ
ncbi:MAG: hypothetical protein ACLFVW_04260 [Phycisphaerae bacterium]